MTLTQETLGERLREARTNAQLNQEEVAAAIGIDRTALIKIEKGTRAVNGVELFKLARLYHRDLDELLSEQPLEDDPFTLLGRITDNESPSWSDEIGQSIELLKEAVRIENFLGEKVRPHPPIYKFCEPRSWEEAIEQGKEMAQLERRRLDLGSAAIGDIAEVIALQGIWTCAVPLPEDTSGLFVSHRKYGLAVFINHGQARARRRFSYAHEYAHALADRDRASEATTKLNSKTLVEKRANAFASEFLMPTVGVCESLERLRKGGTSRSSTWLWDAATDSAVHLEGRQDALAQRLSVHDVAFLAHEYMVSFEAAAIRLKDMDAIRKLQLEEFLNRRDEGRDVMRALKLFDPQQEDGEQPYLVRQIAHLAMEAFRRDKISTGRFREVCNLAGLETETLLWVVQQEIKDK